jgi:hypothetical protein
MAYIHSLPIPQHTFTDIASGDAMYSRVLGQHVIIINSVQSGTFWTDALPYVLTGLPPAEYVWQFKRHVTIFK